jgi:hypothetical protein
MQSTPPCVLCVPAGPPTLSGRSAERPNLDYDYHLNEMTINLPSVKWVEVRLNFKLLINI